MLADVLRHACAALGGQDGYLALQAGTGAALGLGDIRVGLGAWGEGAQAPPPRRMRGASIRSGPAVLGEIVVGLPDGGPEFGLEDPERLARFASLAALAIQNHGHLGSERQALLQAQALRAATQALSTALTLRDVLDAILRELRNVVPYDTASVQQRQDDKMVIIGGSGIDLANFLGTSFDIGGPGVPNHDVFKQRAPVVVPDILGPHPYPEFPCTGHALSGVRSWLGVPLLFGNDCIGMITLDKLDANFYNTQHAQAALAFAAQAAIALKNATLFEQSRHELLERRRAEEELRGANDRLKAQIQETEALQVRLREQAIRDPLTGLFNRRYLTETLQREIARCAREDRPLGVAMIDVDHFKQLNDAMGHDAGDRVLQALGAFLAEQTRHGDVACRYGGEEFVVVLPGAEFGTVAFRAEDWRAAIAELFVEYDDKALRITISVGIAEFPSHARTADDLLRVADVALYDAKHQGRNKVVVAR